MLFGLSGTHGTGKSTLLQKIKNAGYFTADTQISRTAQQQLGWETLSKVEESVENMWKLQELIFSLMIHRDKNILNSKHSYLVYFVDRTPVDVWAYTTWWCNVHNIDVYSDPHAIDFMNKCKSAALNYSHIFVVPPTDLIKFQHQEQRASLESREFVNKCIENFLQNSNINYSTISTVYIEDRLSEVIYSIEGLSV